MSVPKLVDFFLLLEKKERDEFEKLLEIDFFRKEKDKYSLFLFQRLCVLLNKRGGRAKLKSLNLDELSKEICKGQPKIKAPKNNATRNKQFNVLLNYLHSYLAIRQVKKDNELQTQALFAVYKERKIDNWVDGFVQDRIQTLESNDIRDAEYYRQLSLANQFLYSFPRMDQNRKFHYSLEQIHGYENTAYVLNKLHFCCSVLMGSIEYNSINIDLHISHIKESIKLYELDENYLIQLYLQAIDLLKEPTEQNYQGLKVDFYLSLQWLSPRNQSSFIKYLYAAAYIIGARSSDSVFALKEAYGLLNQGFSSSVFIQNNYLDTDVFFNYMVTCGEFKQFIENEANSDEKAKYEIPNLFHINDTYLPFLPERDQATMKYLADAIAQYYHNEYKECLTCIERYMGQNTFRREADKLLIRSLKLRAAFERPFLEIDNICRSYKDFLKRNTATFSKQQIAISRNFIAITESIVAVREQKQLYRAIDIRQEKSRLLQQIERTLLLAPKLWLRRKVKQL